MSGGNAVALALLLYGVALVPFIWIAVRPGVARILGSVTVVAILGLAFVSTGILRGSGVELTNVSRLLRTISPDDRCQEVFQVLLENRVLLEEPDAEGLVVNAATWDQLPPPVRDAVEYCGKTMFEAEQGAAPFEVIRR